MTNFEDLRERFQKIHSVAESRIKGTHYLEMSINNLLATQENLDKMGELLSSMANEAGLNFTNLPSLDFREIKKQLFLYARDQLGCAKYGDLVAELTKRNFPTELIERSLGMRIFQNLESMEAVLKGYPDLAQAEIDGQSEVGSELAHCKNLIDSGRIEIVKNLIREQHERRRLLGDGE